jgi:hypothetical protein
MVGGASTVRFAVLLADPAVGVSFAATPDVVFGWTPGVLLVTLKIRVQLPLAGIVMPPKLTLVVPALNVEGVVPAHVPVTAPVAALMLTSVSLKNAPVRGVIGLLFDKVRVTPEVPPV